TPGCPTTARGVGPRGICGTPSPLTTRGEQGRVCIDVGGSGPPVLTERYAGLTQHGQSSRGVEHLAGQGEELRAVRTERQSSSIDAGRFVGEQEHPHLVG